MRPVKSMPIPRVARRVPKPRPAPAVAPPLTAAQILRGRFAIAGFRDALAEWARELGGEAGAEVLRLLRVDPDRAMALARRVQAERKAASEAGRATRAELASAQQVEEARVLARLRRSGWRALPSGEWKAPDGTTCRSFDAAIRCLDSKPNRCT